MKKLIVITVLALAVWVWADMQEIDFTPPDKLDTIIANQEKILDEIAITRMYLVRIHDLLTGGESLAIE